MASATRPSWMATLFTPAPSAATLMVPASLGDEGVDRSSTSTVPLAPLTTNRRLLAASKAVISAAPGWPPL